LREASRPLFGAAAGLIAANSPFAGVYGRLLAHDFTIQLGGFVETRERARLDRPRADGGGCSSCSAWRRSRRSCAASWPGPRKFALPLCAAAGGLVGAASGLSRGRPRRRADARLADRRGQRWAA